MRNSCRGLHDSLAPPGGVCAAARLAMALVANGANAAATSVTGVDEVVKKQTVNCTWLG